MLTIKQFSRMYDLEIIPVSYEGLTFGKCVWDSGIFGKPKFSHKRMPDYIFSTFVTAGLMSVTEVENLLEKFKKQDFKKASFFNENIEVDTQVVADIEIDGLIKLSEEVNTNKIVKFTFSEIRYKEIELADRIAIDNKMDEIKATKWKEYNQDLRRAFLITQLFYGKIKVYIKKEFKNDLDLTAKGYTLKSDVSTNSVLEYEFNNADLPFAMKLERVKHFNS